jgi:predicted transcriptional regulator
MRSLRQIRKEMRLTQEELSKLTGVHRVLISRAELGEVHPRPSTRKRLESVLGHVDWFEGRVFQTKTGDYYKAETMIRRLVSLTSTLDGEEREAIRELVMKYFKS